MASHATQRNTENQCEKVPMSPLFEKELHIAPMLDVSNRDFHHLMRILSRHVVLWTEMIVDETLCHATPQHLPDILDWQYDPTINKSKEYNVYPLIVQIGGNSPHLYTRRALDMMMIANSNGVKEINLNCECPSSRVAMKRQFGAALMKRNHANDLRDMLQVMSDWSRMNQNFPISVKTRIGILPDKSQVEAKPIITDLNDDNDLESETNGHNRNKDENDNKCPYWKDYESLHQFIKEMTPYCKRFVLHARLVYVDGSCATTTTENTNKSNNGTRSKKKKPMSPAANRTIPPLNYEFVYRLCQDFADCEFWINGGISNLQMAHRIVTTTNPTTTTNAFPFVAPNNLRGCLMGRAAMDNPCLFWDVDRYFYGESKNPCQSRRQLLDSYCQYLEQVYPPQCGNFVWNTNTVENNGAPCPICKQTTITEESKYQQQKQAASSRPPILIPARIIDRALKPILNVFCHLPGSKRFRHECHILSRNLEIRNCGPAYILQQATQQSISNHILDQPFRRTEEQDVPGVA